ncbi:MAG: hydroxyacid dehydrogenase [Methylacidiphilales bacterium]|nr:hydroxyacid dehydrogenase [Candidatus Methylacidiphilales bacterium]
MNKPKGLFALEPPFFDLVYGGENLRQLQSLVDISGPSLSQEQILERPEVLREVELLFSGWGAPRLDRTFLEAAPRLRAVFHAAGSVKPLVTDEFWNREVALFNAASANAIPVAEFTLAQIILSLKRTWWYIREIERTSTYPDRSSSVAYGPGAYGSVVGIVSLGRIGSLVREKLRILDVKVIVHDPFLTPERAGELGVEAVSLGELFRRSDVVTVHTPWLTETDGLINGGHFASMKRNATFINTARGGIVNEEEMVVTLIDRPDLFAVLDVVRNEPPPKESPLYRLPNVVLTPHIAGSQHDECRRLGRFMVEEAERFLSGRAPQWQVTRDQLANEA